MALLYKIIRKNQVSALAIGGNFTDSLRAYNPTYQLRNPVGVSDFGSTRFVGFLGIGSFFKIQTKTDWLGKF